MGFLDHEGGAEFPYQKDDVFEALLQAIPTIPGMNIDKSDKLSGHILARASASMRSWGENIPISLIEVDYGRTRMSVISTPKTGLLFGGAFDLGKNRRNIEHIIETTSKILGRKEAAGVLITTTPSKKKCHYCAELIQADAIKCKHCGSNLPQSEINSDAKVSLNGEELLQKAKDLYNMSEIDGAMDLYKTIILDDPNSPSAETAKTLIQNIYSAKELMTKACNYYEKTNDLGLFKVIVAAYPGSPQADYSREQIKK